MEDGALTKSLIGAVVLHRFTRDAASPSLDLTYRRLYVRSGSLQTIVDPIYDLDTGVVF